MSTAAASRAAALILTLGACLSGQEGEALLRRAEALLCPWPAFQVDLSLLAGGKATRWRLALEGDQLRLDGLEGQARGRALLVREGQIRMKVPGSSKPLLFKGGTAPGLPLPDPALFALGRQYRLQASRNEVLEGRKLVCLELEARSPAASHRRARLWTTPAGLPVQLEFRLASGEVDQRYGFPPPIQAQERSLLPGFTLTLRDGKVLKVQLEAWRPGPSPAGHFALPEPEKALH